MWPQLQFCIAGLGKLYFMQQHGVRLAGIAVLATGRRRTRPEQGGGSCVWIPSSMAAI